MSVLKALTDAVRDGSVEVIDLTAPLSASTPIIQLPPPFGNTTRFALTEISHYDERGPAWYWNDITTGEHTGTHFDAPVHWVTGKDGEDVAQVPVPRLIAPAEAPRPRSSRSWVIRPPNEWPMMMGGAPRPRMIPS